MKTIMSRMKTLIENKSVAGETLSYVKSTEIIHPEIGLTVASLAALPKVSLVPVSTVETWEATRRKRSTNVVTAYLMLRYHQRESSIMGDSTRPDGHGKGILDFVSDFLSIVRSHRLSVDGTLYLDRPIDITSVDYIREDIGDGAHLLVAEITMECVRVFSEQALPGDI